MKICPMGAELFHAEDRRTDMTKLIVAFRHIANAPNKGIVVETRKEKFVVGFQKCCYWY
jgi:hypothetical protein